MKLEEQKPLDKKLQISNLEDLSRILKSHNIDVEKFGETNPSSRKLSELLQEITKGETVLCERGKELIRKIRTLALRVQYNENGVKYLLKEQHQFFHEDGHGREREISGSMTEKLLQDEKANEESVSRALSEELGIKNKVKISKSEEVVETRPSKGYPGLMTENTLYKYVVDLNREQYNESGFVEAQKGKTTCFKWEKLNSNLF